MALAPEHVANLAAALLAVNNFPVDRAHGLMPAFRERGLLEPGVVAAMPQAKLVEAMADAGYRRGGFLPILSFRLYALMEALSVGTLDNLPTHANAGRKADFSATLAAIPGFGPRTAETAWDLFTAVAR